VYVWVGVAFATLVAAAPAVAAPPNIVVMVTDDQPYGSVEKMPWLSRAGFTEFDQAHVNNPLCCPSRATILSGRYSHNTGVEDNRTGHLLDDTQTIATWLDGADYETGLFGKYLNGYPFGRGVGWAPPGWDTFRVVRSAGYQDVDLRSDKGRWRPTTGYSTDVLAAEAIDFVRDAPEPFFAFVTPYGPHAPFEAAERHQGLFDGAPVELPFFNERASGAPAFWKNRPPLGEARVKNAVRSQWEALRSEDEALQQIAGVIAERGLKDNTVIVLISDNGYSLGAHRWMSKGCAYDGCTHVPLMIRTPGATDRQVTSQVSNVDLAPTLAELAGVETPPLDGRSLVPYLNGHEEERALLLHHRTEGTKVDGNPSQVPSFWGIRTDGWKYVEYTKTGARELYDLNADPGELRNLARKPRFDEVEADLRRQMIALRDG
jgi:N-acetylglucosamine-6-sulfatase